MKRWLGIFAVFFIFVAVTARAEQKAVSSGVWGTYWANFQAALAADDQEKVAALTQFPFTYDTSIDKAAFLKAYPKIFDAKAKACLKKAKPASDPLGNYNVFCGETIYTFSKVGEGYRFSDIGAND